jgi:hypothetical protein
MAPVFPQWNETRASHFFRDAPLTRPARIFKIRCVSIAPSVPHGKQKRRFHSGTERADRMESLRHENISVRIPLSLRQQADEIAHRQGFSLNHFVTMALEEKISRMLEREQARPAPRPAALG